jgi:thiamine-phosphate pyrophosphorylase
MQLYAITDRRLFARPEELLKQVILWAESGVDYLQIREKDLPVHTLTALAAQIVGTVRAAGSRTRVLLNGAAEIAAATGCDGVHLTSSIADDVIASAWAALREALTDPVISVSCHTISEVERARDRGATLALFAPVFEKRVGTEKRVDPGILPGQGLVVLGEACRMAAPMSVFALGGVTVSNAMDCVDAGAAGVAAIRLFVTEGWRDLQ